MNLDLTIQLYWITIVLEFMKGGKGMPNYPRISLAACRVNAKLTQKELAEILNVKQQTVLNWENGRTEPSLSQLRTISQLSGIPMDFIFVDVESN